jgi:hypothetical protein
LFIRNLRILVPNDLGCVISGSVSGAGNPCPEADMLVKSVLTVLCIAGIAFYLRFLVALCKECKPSSVGYWVRLRLGSGEDTIADLPERKKPVARAA